MINVGLYIYTDNVVDLSSVLIDNFATRVYADNGILESANCLLTQLQTLGGFYGNTNQAKRVELFNDEKISITSSVANINDISKTLSDYSQTFTVPATKNNNQIFKHWYENSLDTQFTTLKKADAYIELDTVPFRVGKIQLESCDIKNGEPQSYSITFIGSLGNLKDKFAGLFLKDLNKNLTFNEAHNGTIVKDKIFTTAVSSNLMYPLISSLNYWAYGSGYNINNAATPIYYTDLFPALRLQSIFKMIETQFDVTFTGAFLDDNRFKAAYLWLKNAETFSLKGNSDLITWDSSIDDYGYSVDFDNETFTAIETGDIITSRKAELELSFALADYGKIYYVETYENGVKILSQQRVAAAGVQLITVSGIGFGLPGKVYNINILAPLVITFGATLYLKTTLIDTTEYIMSVEKNVSQTTTAPNLAVKNYMPEIKIEDFFSGVLKMFNLTCFSNDGINYSIDTIENYYLTGNVIDLSEYIKSDSTNLTRVKAYKKINFLYEKSESLVNVGFLSANNIEYGNLLYDTRNDGEEYSIKLPFEDLNFNNLKDKLQVGYALKTDLQKYTPKPIILYDYNQLGLTSLTATNLYFSTATSGNGTSYSSYKPFGQEYNDGVNTYSLNFPDQQSTLTNQLIENSLYQIYYSKYIGNIFDLKARLVKVSAVLPISVLTSLKLNNRVLIRDKRYIINSFTTDLTTGEASFELLTDLRIL